MTPPTHYTTLSLPPHASPSTIRSAYKSHALTSHPDKTLHLPASARATHAALFRRVQEAYDVLSNPSLRAAYDRELARHGGTVDVCTSTFHRPETPSRAGLTPPERKASLRKRARAEIADLRARRERRDAQDAKLGMGGLKILLAVWTDMVGEFGEDEGSQELRAYCAVQVQVYLAKIAEREGEAQGDSSQNVPLEDGTEEGHQTQTAMHGMHREDAGRLAKAAAVRGEKEAQRKRVEERDRREAERVARVRGMAGAPVLKGAGAARREGVGGGDAGSRASSSRRKCAKCGGEHRGFVEWKRCAREGGTGEEEDEEDEEKFFRTV